MNDARHEPEEAPHAALLVCRGASCSERAGQAWFAGAGVRAQGHTGCQGRCATGPNAVLVDGDVPLTAEDLIALAARQVACTHAGADSLGAVGGQSA